MYAEMLKAEEQESTQLLQHILKYVWDNEKTYDAWKRGTIIKLPKKGNPSECSNWRGITLLSITSKVFSRIILQDITTALDKLLRQEQAVLRQILEQSHEWNSSLYVVFMDFEKAFDSLHRPSLWHILQHQGISHKIVNIFQALYENSECRAIHNNQVTDPFRVDTGVRQGCILLPVLFSMAVDRLIQTVILGRRQGIQWTLMTVLEDLDHADDIGLLSSKYQDVQKKLNIVAKQPTLLVSKSTQRRPMS